MTIPKAALKYYYEQNQSDHLTYGDIDAMETIMNIAGRECKGVGTSVYVSTALARSKLWSKTLVKNYWSGYGNGYANIYKPSKEGEKYYKGKLKTQE